MSEEKMPLVKQRMPIVQKDLTPPDGFGYGYGFDPAGPDYRGVISQIKREILVEISSYPENGFWPKPTSLRERHREELNLNSLPDGELQWLLAQTMQAARQRGILKRDCPTPLTAQTGGMTQTLVAVLLFPAARQRLLRILEQTVLGGLELVDQAKSRIMSMMGDELF